ncbi:MAG TPA: hypothetical protein VK831_03635 [Candidatus Deferrimicrobiaceae bacterium]|nr:hypothetical protein [Candidatus Deferrimicrobiaceae bacterium]
MGTKRLAAWAITTVALAVMSLVLAGPVGASHVTVRIGVPGTLEVGTVTNIPVALSSADGSPLARTPVTFYLDATFAGVSGEVEVATAVTDDAGVATLAYRPRVTGHHDIRVEYLLPNESEPEIATISVEVAGDAQLFIADPGLSIPGLNVGLLMAILTIVWTILLGVAVVLIRIARAGGEPVREASRRGG